MLSIRIYAHKETSSRVTNKQRTTRNVFFAPRFRTDWRGATLHGRSTPTNPPSRRSPPLVSNCSVPATEGQLTFFCCHSRLISYDGRSRSDTTTRWVVEGHVYLLLDHPVRWMREIQGKKKSLEWKDEVKFELLDFGTFESRKWYNFSSVFCNCKYIISKNVRMRVGSDATRLFESNVNFRTVLVTGGKQQCSTSDIIQSANLIFTSLM